MFFSEFFKFKNYVQVDPNTSTAVTNGRIDPYWPSHRVSRKLHVPLSGNCDFCSYGPYGPYLYPKSQDVLWLPRITSENPGTSLFYRFFLGLYVTFNGRYITWENHDKSWEKALFSCSSVYVCVCLCVCVCMCMCVHVCVCVCVCVCVWF